MASDTRTNCKYLMEVAWTALFSKGQEISIGSTPKIIMESVFLHSETCLMAAYVRPAGRNAPKEMKTKYRMDQATKNSLISLAENYGIGRHVVDYEKRVVMWFEHRKHLFNRLDFILASLTFVS